MERAVPHRAVEYVSPVGLLSMVGRLGIASSLSPGGVCGVQAVVAIRQSLY